MSPARDVAFLRFPLGHARKGRLPPCMRNCWMAVHPSLAGVRLCSLREPLFKGRWSPPMSLPEIQHGNEEEGRWSAKEAWLRALEKTARISGEPLRTLPTVIEELANTHSGAPALLSERQTLTYRELAQASNRYARWAREQGVGVGECVCLFMPNCPEYVAIWLGISRVGGIVALINTSLRGPSLAHCVSLVGPRHAIVDSTLLPAMQTALALIKSKPKCWAYGGDGDTFARIDHELCSYSG